MSRFRFKFLIYPAKPSDLKRKIYSKIVSVKWNINFYLLFKIINYNLIT